MILNSFNTTVGLKPAACCLEMMANGIYILSYRIYWKNQSRTHLFFYVRVHNLDRNQHTDLSWSLAAGFSMSCTISNDLKAHNKKMQYYIKWHILRLYRPKLDSVNFIRNLSFRHFLSRGESQYRNILAALSSVGNTDFQPGFTWSMADLNTSLIKLNLLIFYFIASY